MQQRNHSMWSRTLRSLSIIPRIAGVLLLFSANSAIGADGRDFVGFYVVGPPVQVGEDYAVILDVEFFNYGNEDVNYATVEWTNAMFSATPLATVTALYLPVNEGVRLSIEATVPALLYEQWQKGTSPVLVLSYLNSVGNPVSAPVDLLPGLVKEVSP